MPHDRRPTYDLGWAQSLVAQREYRIRQSAFAGAAELCMEELDIVECVLGLTVGDLYKTMPSEKVPGTYQDVYKTRFQGFAIYLKLQVINDAWTVIISFKRDESA